METSLTPNVQWPAGGAYVAFPATYAIHQSSGTPLEKSCKTDC
jgi:hypothetical protein